MCPGKKNAKCPDNGTEVPEHSLEKIWQNAQITGQKSLKCFRKTICCLSDCHFGSPKNCFEKKMEKKHFFICHHWQNTQLMGQKSLKGSDRTPFNLLRLCFEWCLFWLLFLIQFGAYTIGSYTLGPFPTYHVYKYILLLLGTCGEQVMCCWYTPKWLSRCVFGKTHWFLWGKGFRGVVAKQCALAGMHV